MEPDLHAVLVALGPGGTRELAERAQQLVHTRVTEALYGMEQTTRLPELGGTAEVAARLGRTKPWLGHVLAGRRPTPAVTTPEPLIVLDATPVWDLADWDRWATVHSTLVGDLSAPVAEAGDPFR